MNVSQSSQAAEAWIAKTSWSQPQAWCSFRILSDGFHVYFLDSPEILASESLHYINQFGSKKLLWPAHKFWVMFEIVHFLCLRKRKTDRQLVSTFLLIFSPGPRGWDVHILHISWVPRRHVCVSWWVDVEIYLASSQ
jgi:hypothetical protein